MERVEYKDEQGRKFLVEVPVGSEDVPQYGIRIGPPDLDELTSLPIELQVKLNNQLYDRKLFNWSDVRRRPEEIKAALRAVLRLNELTIINLYKREEMR